VDGYHAARLLKSEDPVAYDILARVSLPWHASGNQGIAIAPYQGYPVLELDHQTGELQRVRWNNDDRGVVPFDNEISPTEWYGAARKWHALMTRNDIEYRIQLRPGRPLSIASLPWALENVC
jgi:hypothetical protein